MEKFNQLLNAYWLRPEIALWRSIDMEAIGDFELKSPSLDFGAGDGIFSFIQWGGQLSESSDAFQATKGFEKYFENDDVYDSFNTDFNLEVTKPAAIEIDVAFDHKANLLKKAEALGLYKELVVGDGNKDLPFATDTFESLFSNVVYWLDDPGSALKELSRVLRPGGKACLMLCNSSHPSFSFYNQLFVKTGLEKWKFLEKLDRGRFSDNVKHAKSASEWEELFEAASFKVVKHTRHLSKPVIQLWDIGLRPLFPVLLRMVRAINKTDLQSIKREWIEIFTQFLEPMRRIDSEYVGDEKAYHCYILQKV